MNVTVKLFGQLIDIFQKEEMQLFLNDGITLREVYHAHFTATTQSDLPHISAAVNNKISSFEIVLKDGDHIDLMPPFAGG